MFRPDPNGEHAVEAVIARLTDVLNDVVDDGPRAKRLAELIRSLRETAIEHPTASAAAAGTG